MKLSVVVPFKGVIKDLEMFLIKHQSLIDKIEIIFVVSRGEDGAAAQSLLKLYGIKVIVQSGKGIYNAFNDGVLEVADGYVLFCGVDDLLINCCAGNNLNHINADIVFIPYKHGGRIIFPRFAVNKTQAMLHMKKILGMPHSHQGVAYHARYLKSHLFNDEYEIAGDYHHLINAVRDEACEIWFAEIFDVMIDVGGGGVSTIKRSLNRSETWRSYKLIYGYYGLIKVVIRKRLYALFGV